MSTRLAKTADPPSRNRDRHGAKTRPAPQPFAAQTSSIGTVPLQRKSACACGGGCPRCQAESNEHDGEVLQRKARAPEPDGVPEIVRAVVRSAGEPLDDGLREYFEPRFGYDFSQVRVHAGEDAAASARAVGALAYTVGAHIVFDRSQAAGTGDRQLLAHELTHVVQQGRGAVRGEGIIPASHETEREADRAAALVSRGEAAPFHSSAATASNSIAPADCAGAVRRLPDAGAGPARVQRACGPQAIGTPPPCAGVQGNIVGERFLFVVNCDDLRPGEQARLELFAGTITAGETIDIHGFSSVDGDEGFNEQLSCARAVKGLSIVQGLLTSRGVHASVQILKHGSNPGPDPAEQRSIVVNRSGIAPPETPAPPAAAPPAFVCGPNVTFQVAAAVSNTRSTFAGWSSSDKESACGALDSLITGAAAWDIVELHNQDWIATYRPPCATLGTAPSCAASVQVGTECYYAGSANYVIFGTMCDLCHSYFVAAGNAGGAARFTQAQMEYWINFYKGTKVTGTGTPSANFVPSREWAIAGYLGWPTATAPAGDRANCSATCRTPYIGPLFSVHWIPNGVF